MKAKIKETHKKKVVITMSRKEASELFGILDYSPIGDLNFTTKKIWDALGAAGIVSDTKSFCAVRDLFEKKK